MNGPSHAICKTCGQEFALSRAHVCPGLALRERESPQFSFQHAAFEPETVTIGRDDEYRQFRFDLCRALDMTKVSIVLGKMVDAGVLDKRMAELFHGQASTLLALMVSENNRAFRGRGE